MPPFTDLLCFLSFISWNMKVKLAVELIVVDTVLCNTACRLLSLHFCLGISNVN